MVTVDRYSLRAHSIYLNDLLNALEEESSLELNKSYLFSAEIASSTRKSISILLNIAIFADKFYENLKRLEYAVFTKMIEEKIFGGEENPSLRRKSLFYITKSYPSSIFQNVCARIAVFNDIERFLRRTRESLFHFSAEKKCHSLRLTFSYKRNGLFALSGLRSYRTLRRRT